ncbi:MAG: peptide-methionine (S)-S-oxide reductase MsrA [Nitrospirae bacterium]|nr:peptide-methionine (S)-S-oxide reductase MsrA [Nitrospirota bacterium]
MEQAIFGAGCFWGVQAAFDRMPGVIETTVGYSGGTLANPTYRDVCAGRTGHAEVVRVVFDPARVSYETLLAAFWRMHDPTTRNRQGPDVGTQYRSAIFFHGPEQRAAAEASRLVEDTSGRRLGPIVTEITAAGPFHAAEDYHQKYLEKHGQSHCHS